MRQTETQSGKGYKLQTLRAIELFLDAVDAYGKNAKIYVSTEKEGDILINVGDQKHIAENKNYTSPHSINSHEVLNTLVNFIDAYILNEKMANVSFGFYTTADKRAKDNFGLENSTLTDLETKHLNESVITNVKNKVIEKYKLIYDKKPGNIELIERFSNEDWRQFLSQIDWKFNLEGNQSLNESLKTRIRNSPFLSGQEEFNGIENSIVDEFRNQLEERQESKGIIEKIFRYSDYENIITKQILLRLERYDYGLFKKINSDKPINEIKIPYNKFIFSSKEKRIIYQIKQHILKSNNGFKTIITGKPAQGKTILSVQIALELIEEDYISLFLDLSNINIQIIETLKKLDKKHNNLICVLTKCHLNLSLFNTIINDSSEYPNINFIFESRPLFQEHIEEDISFINEIVNYHLTLNDNEIFEKYTGIICSYFPSKPLNKALVESIIGATSRNFVYLFEFIKNIKETDIDFHVNIDNKTVKKTIKELYFKKINKIKNEKIIEYAIINQFEIPIKCSNDLGELWFTELINEDSLIRTEDIENDFYQFYHSDDAKLLKDTYFEFKKITTSDQLIFEQKTFIKYLLNYNFIDLKVEKLFHALYLNSASSKNLLSVLLSDVNLQKRLFDYYRTSEYFINETNPSKSLRNILMYVNELCPTHLNTFINELAFENKNFGKLLKSDSTFILTLLKISQYNKQSNSILYEPFFQDLFTDLKETSINISFSTITFYLSTAYKNDKELFNYLRTLFNDELLNEIIIKEEFLTMTEGLGSLYQIYDLNYKFIDTIPIDVLSSKAKLTSIKRLAKAFQNLESLSRKKLAELIFEDYSKDSLQNSFEELEIKEAITIANVLKSYGYIKVYDSFLISNFKFNTEDYNFSELITILTEVNKFIGNPKLSSQFIDKINLQALIEKSEMENPYLTARHLGLLANFKGYENKACEIFNNINNNYFLQNISALGFFKTSEMLHWLFKLGELAHKKTCEIYISMSTDIIQNNFNDESFSKIILGLKNLNQINQIKTSEIFYSSKEIILSKIGKPSFDLIGLNLLQLSDIEPTISFNILSKIINTDEFNHWLMNKPIHELSRTLKEFHLVEKRGNISAEESVVNPYYLTISNEHFIEYGNKTRFDLLCLSLNELSVLDPKSTKTKNLLYLFNTQSLIAKIASNNFINLAQGFSNLYSLDPDFTHKLIEMSIDEIVLVASQTSLEDFSNGLKSFSKIDEKLGFKIFNNDNLNIKALAKDIENYDLDSIKKYVYYLKTAGTDRVRELIQELNTLNLVYKFQKEQNFDKATEYLSHLHLLNESKIAEVVLEIGPEIMYKRCKSLEIKIIIQGLSKIYKIVPLTAKTVLKMIISDRNIVKEIALIPQFSDLTQKINIINKISEDKSLAIKLLDNIGINHLINKIKKSSINQIELGFGSLNQVSSSFSKKLALEISKDDIKYANIFTSNKFLKQYLIQ